MEFIQENIGNIFLALTAATAVVGFTFIVLVIRVKRKYREYNIIKGRTAELNNSMQEATVVLNSYILNLLKKQQELQDKKCHCKEEPANKTEIQIPQQ